MNETVHINLVPSSGAPLHWERKCMYRFCLDCLKRRENCGKCGCCGACDTCISSANVSKHSYDAQPWCLANYDEGRSHTLYDHCVLE